MVVLDCMFSYSDSKQPTAHDTYLAAAESWCNVGLVKQQDGESIYDHDAIPFGYGNRDLSCILDGLSAGALKPDEATLPYAYVPLSTCKYKDIYLDYLSS